MLSAIAARKAAQAAKSQESLETSLITVDDSGSDSARLESILKTPSSKRKPPSSSGAETKKKRKKAAKLDGPQTRYFQTKAEQVVHEADPIIIDITDKEEVQSLSSGSEGNTPEVRFIDEDLGLPKQTRKRVWSPSRPPPDSSDEESGLEQGPSHFSAGDRLPSRDSGYPHTQTLTFLPRPEENIFYVDGNDTGFLSGRAGTLVLLQEGETIALLGVYSLSVLRGAVSLTGSEISACPTVPARHSVFAPRCSPIPILQALPSTSTYTPDLPEQIMRNLPFKCAVIFLEDLVTGVDGLGRICKIFDGVFNAELRIEDVLRLHTARMVNSLGLNLQPFQTPDSWKNSLSALLASSPGEKSIIYVKGQKRTGKSSLARTLLNRLLSQYRRVAFLECDVGQTEFTPPGLVSLHVLDRPVFGPPFTHPFLPYASHYLGSTSPRHSPAHYLSAVQSLIQTYKLDLQYSLFGDESSDVEDGRIDDTIPLIVNTMGWSKGLGADLAKQIEEMVEPSHIFSVQGINMDDVAKVSKCFAHSYPGSSNVPHVFEVEGIPAELQSTRYTAADWRTIALMSYFSSVPSPAQFSLLPEAHRPLRSPPAALSICPSLCTWNTTVPLVARAPYAVALGAAVDRISLVGAGTEDVVPGEVGRVLNGALVALVSCQPGSMDDVMKGEGSVLPYIQGAGPPDPAASTCVGLALIRGVSHSLLESVPTGQESETDTLQMLTPIPPSLLSSSVCRCLVKGEIEIPVWGMLDHRDFDRDGAQRREKEWDGMPYLQWSRSDAAGAERRRVRRNLMRRAQM